MKTPLALFCYNRPQHVELVLQSIARCRRLEECQVYIYSDGPKTLAGQDAVTATRQVVRRWAKELDAFLIERPVNVGVDISVVTAVTDLLHEFGRIIVIEDDFVVSPDYLDYMLSALDYYADVSQVYQISGYMYPLEMSELPQTLFFPLATSRGWASWERAWKIFDWNATGYQEDLKSRQFRDEFSIQGSYYYAYALERAMAWPHGPWDLRFCYSVFKRHGLVLYPRTSLVWVGGWDGTGTHSTPVPDFIQPPKETFQQPQLVFPLTFPDFLEIDPDNIDRIANFLRGQERIRKWKRSIPGRIEKRLKRYFLKLVSDRR